MKLLRYGPVGQERPGLIDTDGQVRDLSAIVPDIAGEVLASARLAELAALDPASLPLVADPGRIGPCVAGVGKFVCIGLNYSDHAAETGATVPPEPVAFMKATSAICGPNDPVIKPRGSTKLDWEVELAFVVGQPVRYADEATAATAIAGYFVCHDVSERAFQMERQGQWMKGKGCDSFGPIGPWLVTADEVGDPGDLGLWLEVNGKRYQNGTTRNMVYRPAFLLSYMSRFMSFQPGDIITTGTPAGVGLGQNPPVYLEVGDRIELGIEKLGSQAQIVVAAD